MTTLQAIGIAIAGVVCFFLAMFGPLLLPASTEASQAWWIIAPALIGMLFLLYKVLRSKPPRM